MLVTVHAGLAIAFKCPELPIDKEEGDMLANATVNMMAEFDIVPDPKTQAVIGMIIAAGIVYGPRAAMIRARLAQEAKERAAGANGAGVAGIYAADGSAMGTTDFGPVPPPPN
jgi:hypothetical protein